MKLELNIKKVLAEMERIGMTQAEAARGCGVSRQLMFYWLKNRTIKAAPALGKLFNLSARDLIV